ncbi:MAG: hypothetical protein JXA60_06930 [Candidatus Coatesbacteria bacterium]|nr:hypothetical protein [Candidatus Coatesbacteria bacterium]
MSVSRVIASSMQDEADCTIISAEQYLGKTTSSIIKSIYLFILRHFPQLYRNLYRKEREKQKWSGQFAASYRKRAEKYLIPLLDKEKIDLAIPTHPVPAAVCSFLPEKYKWATLVMNYEFHSHWLHPAQPLAFVSTEEIKEEFEKRDFRNCVVSGIPVSPRFRNPVGKLLLRKSLGMQEDSLYALVGGGGLGLGPLAKVTRLLEELEIKVVVFCGSNKKLYKKLSKDNDGSNVIILPMIENSADYIEACDFYITKPGGVTITEALTIKTPLVLLPPIPGHEEGNVHFLKKNGIVDGWLKPGDLKGYLLEIKRDTKILEDMRKRMGNINLPESDLIIRKELLRILK